MRHRFLPWMVAALAMVAGTAWAQQTVRGQFLLPNGSPPTEPIRFTLTSTDGRLNDIQFSDSHGRFILPRLGTTIDHIITVDSDGVRYGHTTFQFNAGYNPPTRITLNPLRRGRGGPAATVSVFSSYQAKPEAQKRHQAALKEIEQRKYGPAEEHLRQAIAADPKFLAPLNDLGALMMQRKRYADAEGVLRQAVEADPKSYLARLNLGMALNRRGKFAEAVPHLREALRLEPRVVAGHLELGVALVETEQLADAERHLRRVVLSRGDEEAPALLYLGKLYARTGDYSKGVASLESYLKKAPRARNAGDVRALIERMKREMAKRA